MAGITDDSTNRDAAILAGVRVLQRATAYCAGVWRRSGCAAEVVLGLMMTYVSKTRPTLTHALERAQKASLPSGMLDELMAAAAKIGADCMSTVRCIGDLDAAGGNRVQIARRSIAGVEHVNDEARELTKRINRLLEEFGSRSV